MNLPSAVTIQRPPAVNSDGETVHFAATVLSSLDVTLLDNATRRRVAAQIHPFPKLLVLWDGAAYEAAGDYTQAQAEARVLERLGPDLKAGLEALFLPPVPAG